MDASIGVFEAKAQLSRLLRGHAYNDGKTSIKGFLPLMRPDVAARCLPLLQRQAPLHPPTGASPRRGIRHPPLRNCHGSDTFGPPYPPQRMATAPSITNREFNIRTTNRELAVLRAAAAEMQVTMADLIRDAVAARSASSTPHLG